MPKTKGGAKVFKKFQQEYGKKKGASFYFATANKQGRSPESFRPVKAKAKKKSKSYYA